MLISDITDDGGGGGARKIQQQLKKIYSSTKTSALITLNQM